MLQETRGGDRIYGPWLWGMIAPSWTPDSTRSKGLTILSLAPMHLLFIMHVYTQQGRTNLSTLLINEAMWCRNKTLTLLISAPPVQ
jgi:hypothetical protein